MIQEVEGTFTLDGRTLVVVPSEIAENGKYHVKVTGLRRLDTNEEIEESTFTTKTPYYPMYATLESLRLLVDTFEIPLDNMRSFIRDASRYADFVVGGKAVKDGELIPYEVEEFVRTKATLDSLTRAVLMKAKGGGERYRLDVVEYANASNEKALLPLLDALRKQLRAWQDALRGYVNEGRCKPKVTRVGIKSSSNNDVSYTTVDGILRDISRTVPQWR